MSVIVVTISRYNRPADTVGARVRLTLGQAGEFRSATTIDVEWPQRGESADDTLKYACQAILRALEDRSAQSS
uniref:Uncharacterized protein n=1 Tax=uncultured prokaryote TaxID=198431 RepID=A0A0H5Q2S7_9ZZZZ|nr:hypothetical protein [uncultured prokaryote]